MSFKIGASKEDDVEPLDNFLFDGDSVVFDGFVECLRRTR